MALSATTSAGQILPSLLRAAYPRHTAKSAAIAAGVPHETARNWLKGRASPSLPFLLRWASRCDQMADALQHELDAARAHRDPSPGGSAADLPSQHMGTVTR